MANDVYTLIKPFTTVVDANGNAVLEISHSIHGLAWQVMQIGLSLGKAAPSPQVAATINGIPFVSSVVMGTSVFASMPGSAPVAMTTELTGPPYPVLEAGDKMMVGVTGATAGDIFLAGAYINELESPATQAATQAQFGAAYIGRPGARRWD
jgi:hypothetical protein